MTILTKNSSIRRLVSVSGCTEPLTNSQTSLFHVRLDLSCWYLFHQLAFHQSLWVQASRFPEACVSERPTFLISWFSMMRLYGLFQLCKINIDHLIFLKIITTCSMWILICFLNSCKWYRSPHCSGRDAVDCDSWSTYHLSSQDTEERPREWLIVNFGYKYNGKLATLLKITCNKFVYRLQHCANYWIIWRRSRIDIYVHLLDDHFSDGVMRLWRLSIMLGNSSIFSCAACPSKFSSDQLRLSDGIGSKFHVYKKLLSVSRGILETSEFLCPQVFRSVPSGPFET